MIYRDRIVIARIGDVIGYGDLGEPIYGPTTFQTVPGNVFPLGTTEQLDAGFVSTRYRIVLRRTAILPAAVNDDSTLRFGWGQYPLDADEPFGPTSGLRPDGSVEAHNFRGRLHHYELITKSIQ